LERADALIEHEHLFFLGELFLFFLFLFTFFLFLSFLLFMNKSTANNKLRTAKKQIFSILLKQYAIKVMPGIKQKVYLKEFLALNNLTAPTNKNLNSFIIELFDSAEFDLIGTNYDRNYNPSDLKKLRVRLVDIYGEKCMRCNSTEQISVDHIKPYSLHKELSLDFNNLQLLCKSCNSKKSNKNENDYRPFVLNA
jgi:hypothetical protein